MTTLRPYPAYKPSGIDWLGDIPSNWTIRKAGHCFSLIGSGTTPQSGNMAYHSDGSIPWINTGDLNDSTLIEPSKKVTLAAVTDYPALRLFPCGSLIVAMYGATIGKTGVTNFDTTVNQACCVLAQSTILNIRFAQLAFIGLKQSLVNLGVGGGQPNISQEIVRQFRLPIPPLDEQRAIAAFLDALDERVDRFIAARRRMIALLDEQKQAIINQAVTRGLDPDVPMKPSGIEWLGDIPAHWQVSRLRSCIVDSVAGIWGEDPSSENAGDHIWCVRVADFDMGPLRITDAKKTMRAVPALARMPRLLQNGDVLLEKSGGGENQPVGRAVMFDWIEPAVTSNFVTRLRPAKTVVEPEYFLALMETMQAARITQLSIKQTTGIQNLDERHYLSNSVPIPGIDEQRLILEYIDGESSRIDAVRVRSMREIDLIQEYRTRLISDVVMGKMDVRGVVPDELADSEADQPTEN